VVRDLEHFDRPQQPRLGHSGLRGLLRVAGEHRVEAAASHLQHHARIVRAERLGTLPWRPQNLHPTRTDPPAIADA